MKSLEGLAKYFRLYVGFLLAILDAFYVMRFIKLMCLVW